MIRNLLGVSALLVFAAPAVAGPAVFFTQQGEFEFFAQQHGKFSKGTETFEESTIRPNQKIPFAAPLQSGVSNLAFPNGILANNLIIQDNTLPGPGAPTTSPSGDPQALFATGVGAFGGNSVKIGEDMGILNGVHVSIDLIFLPNEGVKTAVGFDISRYAQFPGANGWIVSVFDTNNNLVGMQSIPEPIASEPSKMFFGAWAPSIGRINIHDTSPNAPEGIDNIQMWVPEPGTLSLLAMTAIAVLRRRRA